MKFDVTQVVVDYLHTLKGETWSLSATIDVLFIFGLPVIGAISTYWVSRAIDPAIYVSLFTVFGIFVAVFISVFSVLVPLYHAPRKQSEDPIVDMRYQNENALRKRLIHEVSATLSYLTLFCVVGMTAVLFPIVAKSPLFLFKWVSVLLGLHLITNLLVIIKRIHALFQYEFDDEA